MQQAAVAQVNLRCPDLTLLQILVPRRELPHHEHAGQQVEVVPHRGLAHAEGTRRLGGIPDLSVIMRKHRPETQQRRRRDLDVELRYVALEKGSYELPAPNQAIRCGSGKIGARKATTQPVS